MEDLLDDAFELTERLGLPLAVAAWVSVFAAVVAMAVVLQRRKPVGVWPQASLVGTAALAAHLIDYAVTLRITPDLSMEANPIWRIAVAHLGLSVAKWYGLTGKLLVSALSFELFAWYLAQRAELFPSSADGLADFVRKLGAGGPRLGNIRSFFAFSFALFGPYFFYVTFMNVSGDKDYAPALPGPVAAIAVYFTAVAAGYFVVTWRAFLRRPQVGR